MIENSASGNGVLSIRGCQQIHMICFNPDGSIQTKINVCSCDNCMSGDFLNCYDEQGLYFPPQLTCQQEDSEDDSVDDDTSVGDDDESDADEDCEAYEIRANNVIKIVENDTVIALYSPPNSVELFFLCKVLYSGVATEKLQDNYNHVIEVGCSYIK